MAIGLDDLKRRRLFKKADVSAIGTVPEKRVKSGQHEARLPSKPWSNRGLAKASLARKRELRHDFHVNQDWLDIHDQSFFGADLHFDYDSNVEAYADNDFGVADNGNADDSDNDNGNSESSGRSLQRHIAVLEKSVLVSIDKMKNFLQFFAVKKAQS